MRVYCSSICDAVACPCSADFQQWLNDTVSPPGKTGFRESIPQQYGIDQTGSDKWHRACAAGHCLQQPLNERSVYWRQIAWFAAVKTVFSDWVRTPLPIRPVRTRWRPDHAIQSTNWHANPFIVSMIRLPFNGDEEKLLTLHRHSAQAPSFRSAVFFVSHRSLWKSAFWYSL